jgi:nucleoside-diphosphate-sugar epimerase
MILITGGNGYIGTAISELLIKKGMKFRIIDNLSGSNPLNLFYLNHADFLWGDVRKKEDIREAFNDVDTVIHLAAILPTTPGMLDEVVGDVESTNLEGTINVLEEARKRDTNVVFASTCNIYGIGDNLREEDEVNPLNPYSRSKQRAEEVCLGYNRDYGLDVKILRLASVYGYSPGIRFNLVVNYFVLRCMLGYNLTVFGKGDNWRPFVHVRDAARAFLSECQGGEVYNVGGENLTIRELAELIRQEINPEVDIAFIEKIQPEFSYNVNFDKFNQIFNLEYDIRKGTVELAELLNKLRRGMSGKLFI